MFALTLIAVMLTISWMAKLTLMLALGVCACGAVIRFVNWRQIRNDGS